MTKFTRLVESVASIARSSLASSPITVAVPALKQTSRYFPVLYGVATPCTFSCSSLSKSGTAMRGQLQHGINVQQAPLSQSFGARMRGFASESSSAARQAGGKTKRSATAAELGMYGAAASIAMIGFAWASVPLYKVFCAATGYGGTVAGAQTVEAKLKKRQENPNPELDKKAAEKEVTVWFNADVADNMPWTFTPTQEYVRVRPGQSTLVFFTAHNKSDKAVTGYSVYNVAPDKAAQYFNKIQCFCFEEQRLRAGEVIDMPVFFYIDSEMAADWHCRNINDITLSYVFHKVDEDDLEDVDDDGPTVLKLHGPGEGQGAFNGKYITTAPVPTAAAA